MLWGEKKSGSFEWGSVVTKNRWLLQAWKQQKRRGYSMGSTTGFLKGAKKGKERLFSTPG